MMGGKEREREIERWEGRRGKRWVGRRDEVKQCHRQTDLLILILVHIA